MRWTISRSSFFSSSTPAPVPASLMPAVWSPRRTPVPGLAHPSSEGGSASAEHPNPAPESPVFHALPGEASGSRRRRTVSPASGSLYGMICDRNSYRKRRNEPKSLRKSLLVLLPAHRTGPLPVSRRLIESNNKTYRVIKWFIIIKILTFREWLNEGKTPKSFDIDINDEKYNISRSHHITKPRGSSNMPRDAVLKIKDINIYLIK